MIDLHCHILPGIDDGPATLEESVALARAQVARGVRTVVATPHIHHDYPDNDAALVARGVAQLRARLAEEDVALEVLTGGEVALTRAIELPDAELTRLRLGGGPWLLVEPPFGPAAAAGVAEALFRLQARGHRIVLAHPERCAVFQKDAGLLASCVERGMVASITASALTGGFGRTIARRTAELVREGLVGDVASDAHSAGHKRVPGMAEHLQEAGFGDQVQRLCEATPRALLEGTPLPAAPAAGASRGVLGRLFRRG